MLKDFESIKKAILVSLKKQKINALQTLLIGSLARGNARNNSDADIMICFKKNKVPDDEKIYDLINMLDKEIGRNVDLIVFEYIGKFVNHDVSDFDFIENAMTDAVQIDDTSKLGKEFIELSNKLGLYKFIN